MENIKMKVNMKSDYKSKQIIFLTILSDLATGKGDCVKGSNLFDKIIFAEFDENKKLIEYSRDDIINKMQEVNNKLKHRLKPTEGHLRFCLIWESTRERINLIITWKKGALHLSTDEEIESMHLLNDSVLELIKNKKHGMSIDRYNNLCPDLKHYIMTNYIITEINNLLYFDPREL